MSNHSSPRVPPNHPFLIRTPPALCKNFQTQSPSPRPPCVNGPTSQLFEGPLRPQFGRLPQFGRAPRPQCPVFGSTDIRERRKTAPSASTPGFPLLPPDSTPPRHNNPHQPSPLGPAFIHSEASFFCSPPNLSSQPQNPKFSPTQPRELPSVTPSSKSSFQQQDVVMVKYPSQEADIVKHPPQEASSQCASTHNIQNKSPSAVSHFQPSHSSWSPGSDVESRMKQEEEQIVSEALAFLQEHKKKKAAEQKQKSAQNDKVADKSTETKNTEEANCFGQKTSLLVGVRNFEELQSLETDPACGFDTLKEESRCSKEVESEDDWKGKLLSPPSLFLNGPSKTSDWASSSEDKKSVMDASIQELSTLLLNCQDGLAKGVQGGEDAQDSVLVDLTDGADVSDLVDQLNPRSVSEAIPKHFPYSMPLDVEVLHSVKKDEMPRVQEVSFTVEDPPLRSELIPKEPPQWFSSLTCSDSSHEEEKPAQDKELLHSAKEEEMQEVKEAEQEKKANTAEDQPDAPFVAQDELLVRGFILSEPQSLSAELWMVESLQDLVSPTLASFVCGFLNTAGGGVIYAGVKSNGEVKGLQMSNADRAHLGQRIQTLTNSLLLPRPPPTAIALDLLPVQTELNQSEVYVVRLLVKPVENWVEQFKVHNLGNGGEGEGVFCRRGPGPQFNRKHEMK